MQKPILGYLFQSLLISFILAGIYWLFSQYYPQFYTNRIFVLIAALLVINGCFHAYFIHTVLNKNEAFVRRFLASTMLKLLLYLIIILAMIFTSQPLIKVILVGFLFFYMVYTAHEIYSILQFIKKNSSQHAKSK